MVQKRCVLRSLNLLREVRGRFSEEVMQIKQELTRKRELKESHSRQRGQQTQRPHSG